MEVSGMEALGGAVGAAVSLFLVWRDSSAKLIELEGKMDRKLDKSEYEIQKKALEVQCQMQHNFLNSTISNINSQLNKISDSIEALRQELSETK